MTSTEPAWDAARLADPHAAADKRQRVQTMFGAIAGSYDLNNRLHSLGLDQVWRRKVVKLADVNPESVVIDVACGTGDLTIAFAQAIHQACADHDTYVSLAELHLDPERAKSYAATPLVNGKHPSVLGIDFTYSMLPLAYRKSLTEQHNCCFINGDAQQLPLPDACCDVVSIAFGIRNVQSVPAALAEFRRVLRPGGRLMILEFSEPENRLIRAMNHFYCHQVMPRTATWISRDKSGAYRYLPKSIETFISRDAMKRLMTEAGFGDIATTPMTFGVCVAYRGVR